jgi:hypothetical protein
MAIYECHEVMLSEIVGAAMGRGERLQLEILGGLNWLNWEEMVCCRLMGKEKGKVILG